MPWPETFLPFIDIAATRHFLYTVLKSQFLSNAKPKKIRPKEFWALAIKTVQTTLKLSRTVVTKKKFEKSFCNLLMTIYSRTGRFYGNESPFVLKLPYCCNRLRQQIKTCVKIRICMFSFKRTFCFTPFRNYFLRKYSHIKL